MAMRHISEDGSSWVNYEDYKQLETLCRKLAEACERVVTTEHQTYDPNSNDPYKIGVVDGHRCAADMVRDTLEAAKKAKIIT